MTVDTDADDDANALICGVFADSRNGFFMLGLEGIRVLSRRSGIVSTSPSVEKKERSGRLSRKIKFLMS